MPEFSSPQTIEAIRSSAQRQTGNAAQLADYVNDLCDAYLKLYAAYAAALPAAPPEPELTKRQLKARHVEEKSDRE